MNRNTPQTKMASALTEAMFQAMSKGGNTGRVGRRILTNNAKMGLNGKPAQHKAETAVGRG